MLVLSRPALDDAKTLERLVRDPGFAPHAAAWAQAYADYEAAGGDPWAVAPAVFTPDIGDAQRALYDTRRKSKPLRDIRRRTDMSCCPMCGSGGRGHLDHVLPRVTYPEFSVFGLNLVPTCPSCNSSNKGETYQGVEPERFLHPYFDTLAADEIWFVEISGDVRAALFTPRPVEGLDPDDATRVRFHLEHVLGWEFEVWAIGYWGGLPQRVRDAQDTAGAVGATEAHDALMTLYRQAVGADGRNSWPAALLRGALARADVAVHLALQASALQPTII
jgi:hypothetical protein